MLADRPPIVGNQTGMDSFTPSGGKMGHSIGNQTDTVVAPNLRGAVTQYGAALGGRQPIRDTGMGYANPALGDEVVAKDEGYDYGSASALAPASGTPGKSNFLDGHVFLVLIGAGVIALAIWGYES